MQTRIQDRINFEELVEHAITRLEEYKGHDIDASEVHFHLFNEDYYIIGTYQAKQWLRDQVFEAIETIREYEQDNFGEINTDFSEPEKIVNMYAYIVGEEILGESDTLRDKWNQSLSDEDIDNVIVELKSLIP